MSHLNETFDLVIGVRLTGLMIIIKERSNGQRFRRSKKNIGLTEEDIGYLKHNTRYDEEEIREWYR